MVDKIEKVSYVAANKMVSAKMLAWEFGMQIPVAAMALLRLKRAKLLYRVKVGREYVYLITPSGIGKLAYHGIYPPYDP